MALNLCWMRSNLLASAYVIEFQITNSLDLTNIIYMYDLWIHSRDEKVKVMLRAKPNSFNAVRTTMFCAVMKTIFNINK